MATKRRPFNQGRLYYCSIRKNHIFRNFNLLISPDPPAPHELPQLQMRKRCNSFLESPAPHFRQHRWETGWSCWSLGVWKESESCPCTPPRNTFVLHLVYGFYSEKYALHLHCIYDILAQGDIHVRTLFGLFKQDHGFQLSATKISDFQRIGLMRRMRRTETSRHTDKMEIRNR